MYKIQELWTLEEGKQFQFCLEYASQKDIARQAEGKKKKKKENRNHNQTKNFNSSSYFNHQRKTGHTEKLASTFCCYLTVHLPSHLPVLATMAIRLRKDKTGHHRVCCRGDNTHLGGNNSAVWPTVCYLRKMHPTRAVTSWAHPAPFRKCTDPPPFASVCCKEVDRYKNGSFPEYWVLSFLFLLCILLSLEIRESLHRLFQKAAG